MFAAVACACLALGTAGCVKKSGGDDGSGSGAKSEFGGKQPFADTASITDPPVPTTAPGNPLVGAKLFVDPQSLSMLVIDATGKVARVMSVPRSDDDRDCVRRSAQQFAGKLRG